MNGSPQEVSLQNLTMIPALHHNDSPEVKQENLAPVLCTENCWNEAHPHNPKVGICNLDHKTFHVHSSLPNTTTTQNQHQPQLTETPTWALAPRAHSHMRIEICSSNSHPLSNPTPSFDLRTKSLTYERFKQGCARIRVLVQYLCCTVKLIP